MASPTRHGFPSLMGLFILFLSLFNIVNSSPLPETKVDLVAREPKLITQDRYEAFLKKHYPTTDKYAFYTANSYNQLKAFIDANAGYESYKTMIEGPHWYDDFNEADDEDDAEAASAAMATLASGDVLVFGAVEWKKKGGSSIWTSHEVPNLKAGLGGRVKSINHMIKDATDPSSVLATDDGDGNMTWKPGHSEGETNATPCPSSSSRRSLSRRDPRDDCDAAPQPEEPPPGPPKDPKSLQIISVLVLCEHPACDSYSWKFMEGDPGTGVDSCGKGVRDDVEVLGDALDDKFPNGEWDMRFDGYTADCRYQGLGATGPGGDVGWLHCPEREAIKCIESPEYKGGDGDRNDCGAIPVAYCDWE